MPTGRTPQGVRGLKLINNDERANGTRKSHSARSAWIETGIRGPWPRWFPCRTPQGVRGLKPAMPYGNGAECGRTPQGVRGLKLLLVACLAVTTSVALRKECVD